MSKLIYHKKQLIVIDYQRAVNNLGTTTPSSSFKTRRNGLLMQMHFPTRHVGVAGYSARAPIPAIRTLVILKLFGFIDTTRNTSSTVKRVNLSVPSC